MKGILVEKFGGPEVLKYTDLPAPEPKSGEVIVNLKAIGVNPKDAHYTQGLYPDLHSPPFVPGIDGAGIVTKVAKDVKVYKPGDRVFVSGSISGTYAEYTRCYVQQVHPLPETLSFAQGAAIGVPYRTAFRALYQRGKAVPGESVLIHGATGGVGLGALQISKMTGIFIIATAGTPEGMELLKREGADVVVNHKEPGYMDQIVKLNGGRKIDVILEMQAHINLGHDLEILAKNGRIVVIGSLGTIAVNPQYLKDTDGCILSVSLLLAPKEDLELIDSGLRICLKRGTINPIVSQFIPLSDASKALEKVLSPGHKGKIILTPPS